MCERFWTLPIVEAFPWNTAPTYLVRDNDSSYGQVFKNRLRSIGNPGSADIAKVTLAKRICRTNDRLASS